MKDDLDGIDLRLKPDAHSVEVAKTVTAILNGTHHNVPDFSVTIPDSIFVERNGRGVAPSGQERSDENALKDLPIIAA